MKLYDIIDKSTDFGTFRSRDNFISFTLKMLFYIVPAIVLGHTTDSAIKVLKINKVFRILLQTFINILTLYIFVLFLRDFMSEFQSSLAGSYFIVLYFGMQTNYMYMLKEYLATHFSI